MVQAQPNRERPWRIVVVEDDKDMAELLAYNLAAARYVVDVIESGTTALDRLCKTPPDLIVLDWGLPTLSGIELLRLMRKRMQPLHIPVIMLTGRTERLDRLRALDTGADDFISKPFAMKSLMEKIADLLALPTETGNPQSAGCAAPSSRIDPMEPSGETNRTDHPPRDPQRNVAVSPGPPAD